MVVAYQPRRRLFLHHFTGTVLPEVWRMIAFTCAMALIMCFVYDPMRRSVRDGGKKSILYYVFQDVDAFFSMCTAFVTFILSFFNATVFNRWWKLRELVGSVNGRTTDTTVSS